MTGLDLAYSMCTGHPYQDACTTGLVVVSWLFACDVDVSRPWAIVACSLHRQRMLLYLSESEIDGVTGRGRTLMHIDMLRQRAKDSLA